MTQYQIVDKEYGNYILKLEKKNNLVALNHCCMLYMDPSTSTSLLCITHMVLIKKIPENRGRIEGIEL